MKDELTLKEVQEMAKDIPLEQLMRFLPIYSQREALKMGIELHEQKTRDALEEVGDYLKGEENMNKAVQETPVESLIRNVREASAEVVKSYLKGEIKMNKEEESMDKEEKKVESLETVYLKRIRDIKDPISKYNSHTMRALRRAEKNGCFLVLDTKLYLPEHLEEKGLNKDFFVEVYTTSKTKKDIEEISEGPTQLIAVRISQQL